MPFSDHLKLRFHGQDVLHGGNGNDDITGGHSQRFGSDTGDLVYGGAGEDVVLGDNGQILRIRASEAGFYPWVNGMVWLTYPAPFAGSVVRNVSRYDDIDYVEVRHSPIAMCVLVNKILIYSLCVSGG